MREASMTIEVWSVHTDKPIVEGVSEKEAWQCFLKQSSGETDAKLLRGTTVMSSMGKKSPVITRNRFGT